jgi:hypothetical protein
MMMMSMNVFSQQAENNNASFITQHSALSDSLDYGKDFHKNFAPKGKVTSGLKAGYTHGNLFGSDLNYIFSDSKTEWLSGIHFGVVVNTQAGKYIWLKHELLFSQRGAGVTLSDSMNGDYSSKLKTYYLDLYPLSPSFHLKGFQLYAGPYFSILAAANMQRKDGDGKIFTDKSIFGNGANDESENKYLQKFDFGIHAGIEYQFPFGLLMGAKYMHGFTDIFQYANSYTFEDAKTDNIRIYNRALMVSLGYTFKRKSR